MQPDLLKILPQFDVISFDIFDTLLLRPYLNQVDLWAEIDCHECAKNKFLKARIVADNKTYDAATKRGGEHTIHEAYSLMPKKFAAFEAKEEKLQRECLQVNAEMLEVWSRAGELGKKRIIVSDMYLSEEWFTETMREKGFGDYDALYVSSGRQARKSTGKLFEIVKGDFPSEKILHIGDNKHSDKIMPQANGINGWHYPNYREQLFTECPFLGAFVNDYPSHVKRLLAGEMVLGWQRFVTNTSNVTYWQRFGYFFGGLLGYVYVSWLAKTAKEFGIDHLMFVARDGHLWKQMFDRLKTGIRTDYFYAPRLLSLKVCGVIGSDPWAVDDRKKVLETLPPFNGECERQRYVTYLSQFDIGVKTAIVDGISSAFSVQTLVEKTLGRGVPTFYLMAISPLCRGAALFDKFVAQSNWQQISEFVFSSPERPIVDVGVDGPVYANALPKEEMFRESVFQEIEDGAMAGFEAIHNGCATEVDGQIWLDMFDSLRSKMTEKDSSMLLMAKNATNINQDHFEPIVQTKQGVRIVKRFGLPIGVWRGRSMPDAYETDFYALGRFRICKRK